MLWRPISGWNEPARDSTFGTGAPLRALAGGFQMTTRSGRGRWKRVLDAREQTRLALGREPGEADFYGPPKARVPQARTLSTSPAPLHPSERTEIVLTI